MKSSPPSPKKIDYLGQVPTDIDFSVISSVGDAGNGDLCGLSDINLSIQSSRPKYRCGKLSWYQHLSSPKREQCRTRREVVGWSFGCVFHGLFGRAFATYRGYL